MEAKREIDAGYACMSQTIESQKNKVDWKKYQRTYYSHSLYVMRIESPT
jgi:hypothetical protein